MSEQVFALDKNVPIPDDGKSARRIYPFPVMEVGDSFFIPAMPDGEWNRFYNRVAGAVFVANKKNSPKNFIFRRMANHSGIRIWRTA